LQTQKQGNTLPPQELNQLIILTAVKNSNDGYFVEMPSKTYLTFLVFSGYLRNLKFSEDQPLQITFYNLQIYLVQMDQLRSAYPATRVITYFYSRPDCRI